MDECPKCGSVMLDRERIKPLHGSCCCCQTCGRLHDNCVCHEIDGEQCVSNQITAAKEQAEAQVEALSQVVTLRKLTADEGGGWQASIPVLGDHAFVGDGDTPEEACSNLAECAREIVEQAEARVVELADAITLYLCRNSVAMSAGLEHWADYKDELLQLAKRLDIALANAAPSVDAHKLRVVEEFVTEVDKHPELSSLRQAIDFVVEQYRERAEKGATDAQNNG